MKCYAMQQLPLVGMAQWCMFRPKYVTDNTHMEFFKRINVKCIVGVLFNNEGVVTLNHYYNK